MKTTTRGNSNALLVSTSRTTAQVSGNLESGGARGIHVIVDLTVNTGGLGSITVTITGVDPASGKAYTLLASAALTAVATTVLKVFPGGPVSANSSANDSLPSTFQVNVTANNANPVTYSVGYNLLP